MASPAISGVTARRAPAEISAPPIAATRTPTVRTSHLSTFGPVTASNDRMSTIGQMPVAAKYTPCPIASAFCRSPLLMLQLLDWARQHRRVGTLDVDLVPARDDGVGPQAEQVADDREPLEHGTGSEMIFRDFVAVATLLGANLFDAPDDAARALASPLPDQTLDATQAPPRRVHFLTPFVPRGSRCTIRVPSQCSKRSNRRS